MSHRNMNDACIHAICEIDDYPLARDLCIQRMDEFRTLNPTFCATLFAVPAWMKDADWEPFGSRSWLRAGMHGFNHEKGECATEHVEHSVDLMERHNWRQFARIFKAPHYGYSLAVILALARLGIVVCLRNHWDIVGVPKRQQKYVGEMTTRIGGRACFIDQAEYKVFHRHLGHSGVTDLEERLGRYRQQIPQYEFRFSEDVAVRI